MSPGTRRASVALATTLIASLSLGSAVFAQDQEEQLIYAIDGQITQLNNANSDVPTAAAIGWLYSALYAYDQALTPVPDLAAGPAEISEDGLTWTIKLVENSYFQPTGDQLTADDVVFTYRMAMSPNCRFNPSLCLGYITVTPPGASEPVPVLESVDKIDDFTVQFKLADVYAPFVTTILPGIYIDSKKAVTGAFEKFSKDVKDIDVEKLADLLSRIQAEKDAATAEERDADVAQFREEAEGVLNKAGIALPNEADFAMEDGTTDIAAYMDTVQASLDQLNSILTSQKIDKIAAAYPLLSTARKPVGSGPFYVTEFRPGQDLTAVANPKYHRGEPQIKKLLMPIITDDVAASAALKAGDIDWKYSLTSDGLAQVANDPNVKLAQYADFGYFALMFNQHQYGADQGNYVPLFSEQPVRQALAYCIDKPATVEVATDGRGVPIYADIPPASWAYNPAVATYDQDLEAAAALLDGAGWTDEDGDGIRAKDGRLLQTEILVRAGKPDRIKFMQLLADQAKDCGFDIAIKEADFATVLLPGLEYPHIFPGTDKPWDAYFGGWSTGLDPDPYSLWHSSQCTTADLPDTYNFVCFQDEEADKLIEDGLRELDQAKRAEIYQGFEQIMADQLPYLWAWSDRASQGLRATVNGAEAWTPENMTSPTFSWEVEKINNVPTAQ